MKLRKQTLRKIIREELKSVNEAMDKQQAGELLKQLGGNRFIAMTGAKNFTVGPKGAGFKIGKNSKGINYVRIDLDGRDLYNMEFIQLRGGNIKIKSKEEGVYADQLRKVFTQHTGLYTSLGESINEDVWTPAQKKQVEKLDDEFRNLLAKKGIEPYSNTASKMWKSAGFQKNFQQIFQKDESINEANVVGKAVFDDGKGKLAFGYYKDDDEVALVDYKTWKKLNFKDVSKGDTNKDRLVKAILRKQKQFNKKVEYNMWSKKTNPSFEEKMDWFIKNGWISNVTKRGIKESIREAKITVTSIDKIPNIQNLVNQKKVTYRGLGMGKLYNNFYDIAGEGGTRIKVNGKEYYITDTDFEKLGGHKKIRFAAPFRRESVVNETKGKPTSKVKRNGSWWRLTVDWPNGDISIKDYKSEKAAKGAEKEFHKLHKAGKIRDNYAFNHSGYLDFSPNDYKWSIAVKMPRAGMTRKEYFDSLSDALKWGKKNIHNFDRDQVEAPIRK